MTLVATLLMRAFGRPTGWLGRLGGTLMARTNQSMAERAVAILDVRSADHVLEVGFGPGVAIEILSRVTLTGRVAGIDLSDEMVAQALARNAKAVGDHRVDLRRGSVDALPFASSMFDRVLSASHTRGPRPWRPARHNRSDTCSIGRPKAEAGPRRLRRAARPRRCLVAER